MVLPGAITPQDIAHCFQQTRFGVRPSMCLHSLVYPVMRSFPVVQLPRKPAFLHNAHGQGSNVSEIALYIWHRSNSSSMDKLVDYS